MNALLLISLKLSVKLSKEHIMVKLSRRKFLVSAGAIPVGVSLLNSCNVFEEPDSDFEYIYDPWIEIDLNAISHNLKEIKRITNNRPVMAVIKGNAYGHGLINIAKYLKKQKINHFAVGKVSEAIDLRKNGINSMILNFGPYSYEEAEILVREKISQSVYNSSVDLIARAAYRQKVRARVHIKIDTGLGRVGVQHFKALEYIQKLASMPEIIIEGIFTTLTEEKEFDKIQLKRFNAICDEASSRGIEIGIRHAASSATLSTLPEAFLDMVRPGNCIYGLHPAPKLEMKQAMTLKTRIINIKDLQVGDSVSYHRVFTARKITRLATLPTGYSDGYPFQIKDKANVIIGGQKWPLVADITANHSSVNITGSKDFKIGDEVVLIGNQNGKKISLTEIAEWAGSSEYKVAIGMNPFMKRKYI